MNAKQVKYFEIVSEFFASDILKPAAVDKYFGEMLKHDYAAAEDLWEFMLIKHDADLKNQAFAALYIDRVFTMFFKFNQAKAIKTVTERPTVMRAVFGFSPSAATGDMFAIPINLLVAGKVDIVDGIFKNAIKNEAMKPAFGGYMVAFLDRFFIEMMKKDAQRKVKLSSKQTALLTGTVQKVRGDERAMLIQRVKEVQ